eukprot:SAG11_NODE_18249_length_496_cov_0.911839_1_plen_27_part_10
MAGAAVGGRVSLRQVFRAAPSEAEGSV